VNVSLPNELEQYVNAKVASGLYTSASEVVREGLRLLRERDERTATELEEVRRKVAEGVAQLKRGKTVDPAQLRSELRERGRARRRK
jgi:antitoxin ParD1/3/4